MFHALVLAAPSSFSQGPATLIKVYPARSWTRPKKDIFSLASGRGRTPTLDERDNTMRHVNHLGRAIYRSRFRRQISLDTYSIGVCYSFVSPLFYGSILDAGGEIKTFRYAFKDLTVEQQHFQYNLPSWCLLIDNLISNHSIYIFCCIGNRETLNWGLAYQIHFKIHWIYKNIKM